MHTSASVCVRRLLQCVVLGDFTRSVPHCTYWPGHCSSPGRRVPVSQPNPKQPGMCRHPNSQEGRHTGWCAGPERPRRASNPHAHAPTLRRLITTLPAIAHAIPRTTQHCTRSHTPFWLGYIALTLVRHSSVALSLPCNPNPPITAQRSPPPVRSRSCIPTRAGDLRGARITAVRTSVHSESWCLGTPSSAATRARFFEGPHCDGRCLSPMASLHE